MWKDSETELDFLDFDYLIEILNDTVNDKKLLPSSVAECKNIGLLQECLEYTMSCSHPDVGRYKGMKKTLHCGYCLPCTIRKAAILCGGLNDTSEYLHDNYQAATVAKENLKVYKLALATIEPKSMFLKIQESGPIEDNIIQYAELYKRGMNELEIYLEAFNV